METTSIYDVLLAVATILATFGTAIGTFVAVRNQVKSTNIDSMKTDKMLTVEVAERVNAMSLNFAEKMEHQLSECNKEIESLREKLTDIVEIKIKLALLANRLRDIIEKHNQMADKDCPGYAVINSMITDIIKEIEEKVKEE